MSGLAVAACVLAAVLLGGGRDRRLRLLVGHEPPVDELRAARALDAVRELLAGATAGRHRGSEDDGAAEAVSRLATMLRAGLDPASAWRHLVGSDGHGPGQAWAAAARAAAVGAPVAPALRASLDRAPASCSAALGALAATWSVCERSGAPPGAVLSDLAEVLRQEADAADARRAALAAPTATARLLAVLPVLGLVLGQAVGASPLQVLLGTSAGRLAGVVGLVLAAASWAWTRALLRSAVRAVPVR